MKFLVPDTHFNNYYFRNTSQTLNLSKQVKFQYSLHKFITFIDIKHGYNKTNLLVVK